jgi:polysaccharide export outer membrane protein
MSILAQPAPTTPSSAASPQTLAAPATEPPSYVIGPDDSLAILFWSEKELSGDVIVRPDGKISLPLLNEIQAAGLTPEQLRASLTRAAQKYVEDGTVTVVVKAINSRRVFITGQVTKPGAYPLPGPMTVLQLIAIAGGLVEYADAKNISVIRTENGTSLSYPFNFNDVRNRKNVEQNIELKPGDTVIVP